MCGICGIVYRDRERGVDKGILARMTGAISHRGPDDEGFFVQGNVGLGMRRLSIIDLAGGHQPLSNEDGTIWVVFNGEIYNYPALRRELEGRGHSFATRSDTEVIVHAYEEAGTSCPRLLEGMFAFALWDLREERLLLARDRVGIKPLYYWADGPGVVFGSELKCLLLSREIPRELDPVALDQYLTLEYIPAPRTIFRHVGKLPAGHTLTFHRGRCAVERYWDLHPAPAPQGEREAREGLLAVLQESVRSHLLSDVPLGAFLSGGIDSSTVVALMARTGRERVRTFSIGFEDSSYDELAHARRIATLFGTEHHELLLRPRAVELVEELIGYLDEPFGDFSIFPTYLVSKMAREHVKVVLSGDGGDELFAGYDTYLADRLAGPYRALPNGIRAAMERGLRGLPPRSTKKGWINIARRFAEGVTLPADLAHTRWMIFLREEEKQRLYTCTLLDQLEGTDPYEPLRSHFRAAGDGDSLSRQLYVDLKTYLADDILVKVDRMSMAVSLETRVPFLDRVVVEYAAGLPSHLKLRGLQRKYILRRALEGILPRATLRRGKQGFSIPMKTWLRGELRPLLEETLTRRRLNEGGYFSWPVVQEMMREHLAGTENHSHRLWALLVFELWRGRYYH